MISGIGVLQVALQMVPLRRVARLASQVLQRSYDSTDTQALNSSKGSKKRKALIQQGPIPMEHYPSGTPITFTKLFKYIFK